MNYRQRKQRVLQAEQQLSAQLEQSARHTATLRETFCSSLSPLRVLAAGTISGFVTGKLRPARLSHSTLRHSQALIQLPALLLSLAPLLERLQQNSQQTPSSPVPSEEAET